MRMEKLRLELGFHLPPDPAEFAQAAKEMRAQMEPGRWAVLVLLAESVVAESQAEWDQLREVPLA